MRSRSLTEADAALARALIGRGIRQSDIAALMQCNAGRIAEIHTGQKFPGIAPADLGLPEVRMTLLSRLTASGKRMDAIFKSALGPIPPKKGQDR